MTKNSVDTYSARSMSFGFPWPTEVTGIERIILSAQGDLQRNLSAFFAHPITVSLAFSRAYVQESPDSNAVLLSPPNPKAVASASPAMPIVQQRQVDLMCAGKVVCTATSTVRIASPECARLVLEEKYAVGQVFRRLAKPPMFELLAVGMGRCDPETGEKSISGVAIQDASNQIWRKYRLAIPEFECDILEVFPSRSMFTLCGAWLIDCPPRAKSFSGLVWPSPAKTRKMVYSSCGLILLLLLFWNSGSSFADTRKQK